MTTTSTVNNLPSYDFRALKTKAEIQIAEILSVLESATGMAVGNIEFDYNEIRTPSPDIAGEMLVIARRPTVTITLEL